MKCFPPPTPLLTPLGGHTYLYEVRCLSMHRMGPSNVTATVVFQHHNVTVRSA